MTKKTGFDRFLDKKMGSPVFRQDYEAARAEIDATDALSRALDGARSRGSLSKAELARRVNVKPEIVRRLLTDEGGNPTVGTVLKITNALGYHLELVPNAGRRATRQPEAARRTGSPTATPIPASGLGTPPRAAARGRSRAR